MEKNYLTKKELKELAIGSGASDAGVISLQEVSKEQQAVIKKIFPKTKALISIAVKYNQNAVRSDYRSIANNEFQNTMKKVREVSYDLQNLLIEKGIQTVGCVLDFPMETDMNTYVPWLVAHKEIAVKAGIGKMGIHRLVVHKVYGANILLNTLLVNYEFDEYDKELEENPCIGCNLCMNVCPTGSIRKDDFNFMGCYTHNYRDMRNGFLDLMKRLEEGNGELERISASERMAIWQSMQYGSNYRCSNCVSVCPAAKGELEQFKEDKEAYFNTYVKPLKEKEETIYVLKGQDSDYYVDNLKSKKKKYVSNGL